MQVLENTNSYYIDFESLNSRLDFVYNHPTFDYLNELKIHTDYDVLQLSDICDEQIISGTTPKNLKYDKKNGIELLGASDVFDTGIKQKRTKKISKEYLENSMSNLVISKGDVLITIAGTVGKCGIYDKEESSLINQNVAKIKTNNKIIKEYLVLFLNSEVGKDIFQKFRHDVGQPYINTDELSQLPIIVPKDTKIQNDIVNEIYPIITESKDLKIGLDDSINNMYDELISFLGFDLKLKDNNLYFNTDNEPTYSYFRYINNLNDRIDFIYNSPKLDIIDELNKDEKFVCLSDVCIKPLRRGEQPVYNKNGDGLAIKTSSLKNLYIDYYGSSKILYDFTSNKSSIIHENDILLSSTGIKSLGKVDIFDSKNNAIADGHVSIITLDQDKYDIRFVVYFLRSALGQLQIEKYWTGSSGQIELNINEVGKILIPSHEKYTKDKQSIIANKIEKEINNYLNTKKNSDLLKQKAYNLFKDRILKPKP